MNERDYHDQHYASDAARILHSPLFQAVHERAAADFLSRARPNAADRVLSLGCGDGGIELRLASYVGEVVATDISPVAIEQARLAAASVGVTNIRFMVSPPGFDWSSFGRFDVVSAFAFLHHLDDAAMQATLVGARQILRPGGRFYSADPSRRRLVGRLAWLVRGTYARYHSPDERELDPEQVGALARGAGFADATLRYTDFFLGPLAWLAPGTPAWLASPLSAMDDAALAVPGLRRYASSFSLLARVP
jgi:SAM-dependent methyltransferase